MGELFREKLVEISKSMPQNQTREDLRKKLRDKIKSKKTNRWSRKERDNHLKDYYTKMKKQHSELDISEFVNQMFKNSKQRKINKKKLNKLLGVQSDITDEELKEKMSS